MSVDFTPDAPEKPKSKTAAAVPFMISFRIFANNLDAPLQNALRVKMGLKHSEIDTQFDEAELKAALAELGG